MLDIVMYSIIIYIFLGLIFWEWVQHYSLSARAKWDTEYAWDSKAVLIISWFPIFVAGTYSACKDWMKS
jgi:hypothetical protein